MMIRSGQSVTGARVDIRGIDVDWMAAKITLEDIEFANPRAPMENLVQYQAAELDLDATRLLHKEFVVENAKIENIQFSTPRIKSGQLSETEKEWPPVVKWMSDSASATAKRAGKRWLNQFEFNANSALEDNLETVRVSRRIHDQWTARYRAYDARVASINKQIDELRKVVKQPSENPLRDLERVQIAVSKIQSLNREARKIRDEVRQMDDQIRVDRQSLQAAKQRDEAKIRQSAEYFTVDSQKTTELLLGQEKADQVAEIIEWVNWFQRTLPNPEKDFVPSRHRGETIAFEGLERRPKFWVKHSEISGKGQIGGERFEFKGTANHLTNQPKLCKDPTRIDLITTGEKNIRIAAILDRRTETPKDKIRFRIQDMDLPQRKLGSPGSMMVQISPSKLKADLELEIVDNQIQGVLRFVHSGIQMELAQLEREVGGPQLAANVNRQLQLIDNYTVEIVLSGTREKLSTQLKSNLGDQVASAFESGHRRNSRGTKEETGAKDGSRICKPGSAAPNRSQKADGQTRQR